MMGRVDFQWEWIYFMRGVQRDAVFRDRAKSIYEM